MSSRSCCGRLLETVYKHWSFFGKTFDLQLIYLGNFAKIKNMER